MTSLQSYKQHFVHCFCSILCIVRWGLSLVLTGTYVFAKKKKNVVAAGRGMSLLTEADVSSGTSRLYLSYHMAINVAVVELYIFISSLNLI